MSGQFVKKWISSENRQKYKLEQVFWAYTNEICKFNVKSEIKTQTKFKIKRSFAVHKSTGCKMKLFVTFVTFDIWNIFCSTKTLWNLRRPKNFCSFSTREKVEKVLKEKSAFFSSRKFNFVNEICLLTSWRPRKRLLFWGKKSLALRSDFSLAIFIHWELILWKNTLFHGPGRQLYACVFMWRSTEQPRSSARPLLYPVPNLIVVTLPLNSKHVKLSFC